MAGNVLAEVIDGTLFIDGDNLANGIAIQSAPRRQAKFA